MRGAADLTTWRRDEDFRKDPTPLAVLDEDLVFRAVNPAYEQATGHSLAMVESRHVFDVFPANPGEPDGDEGPTAMRQSYEQVLRDARPHNLVVQRYDVPDPLDPERFVTRTWLPVNLPVHGPAEQLIGVATRAVRIDVPDRAQRVLRRYRDALREAAGSGDADDLELVETLTWGLQEYAAAAREVGQLREALVSRSTIDQAKGIVMAERRVSHDEAFQVLVRLSQESNVRLADVARALVYQVQTKRD